MTIKIVEKTASIVFQDKFMLEYIHVGKEQRSKVNCVRNLEKEEYLKLKGSREKEIVCSSINT